MEKCQSALSRHTSNNMGLRWKIMIIYVVVMLITATSGNHFMRGCQDIDPRCALIDEMRANGGKVLIKFWYELCFEDCQFLYSYRCGPGRQILWWWVRPLLLHHLQSMPRKSKYHYASWRLSTETLKAMDVESNIFRSQWLPSQLFEFHQE